jgi:hypothetical protein
LAEDLAPPDMPPRPRDVDFFAEDFFDPERPLVNRLVEDFFADDFFAPERPLDEARPVVRLEDPRPEDVPVRPVLLAELEPRPADWEEDFFDADFDPDFFEADFVPDPEDRELADAETDFAPDFDPDFELDFAPDFEPPRWDDP